MKNKLFILLLILVCQSGLAQSWSHNFVRERKPLTRINNLASLESKSNFKDSVSTDIQYFDGMDRPKQKVSMFASPSGKDIIIPIKYDAIGREVKNYLPYASITVNNGAYASDDEAEQTAFYSSGSPNCITDT